MVVARYKEQPLDWLAPLVLSLQQRGALVRVTVYEKGGLHYVDDGGIADAKIVQLPNVGREFHSYLLHILRNWGRLGTRTVFVPGSAHSNEAKWELLQAIVSALPGVQAHAPQDIMAAHGSFVINSHPTHNSANRAANPTLTLDPADPRPLSAWARTWAPGLPSQGPLTFGGVHAATRESILSRPFDMYAGLLATLDSSPNPEAGHYVERIWANLLRPLPMPKVVWLLWWQGWDTAPRLVQGVAQTWRHHNPSWTVVLLDAASLPTVLPGFTPPAGAQLAAVSDLIRLELLASWGGVWADATLACLRPLDDYVGALSVGDGSPGVWMYHGRDGGRGPASWFIIARPAAPLISRWLQAAWRHWDERDGTTPGSYNYFWMDAALAHLLRTDEFLRQEWARVQPFAYAEAPGSSHAYMNGKADALRLMRVSTTPPVVVKLSTKVEASPFPLALQIVYASLAGVLAGDKTTPVFPEATKPPVDEGTGFF